MSYIQRNPNGKPCLQASKLPHEEHLTAIAYEVARARKKFPEPAFLLAALTEEVGELAQAMLDFHVHKKPGASRKRIDEEAIQVAAMAIRILEEGDPSFLPPELPRSIQEALNSGDGTYKP